MLLDAPNIDLALERRNQITYSGTFAGRDHSYLRTEPRATEESITGAAKESVLRPRSLSPSTSEKRPCRRKLKRSFLTMAYNRVRTSLLGVFILLLSHSHIIAAGKPNFDKYEVVTFDAQNCNHKATRPDGTILDQETSLRTAFGDANLLAHAGVNAAAKPHDPPFSYYFHPEDNETVVENLQMVIALTEDPKSFGTVEEMVWGGGGKVLLNCNQQQWCTLKNQWGYSQVWEGETRHRQWE